MSHTSPPPPPDDRSSRRIYPRGKWFGHLLSPTKAQHEWKLAPNGGAVTASVEEVSGPRSVHVCAERLRVAHRSRVAKRRSGEVTRGAFHRQEPVAGAIHELFSRGWCAGWARR